MFMLIIISCTLAILRTSTLLHSIAYASRSRLRPAIRRLWYMDEADNVQLKKNHRCSRYPSNRTTKRPTVISTSFACCVQSRRT